MKKTYYKVVTSDLESYSKLYSSKPSRAIQYKLGEFVYPSQIGTFLFVFDTIENAMNFKGASSVLNIYECECECVLANSVPQVHSDDIWPTGTCFAYGVKLVKKIEPIRPFTFYVVDSNDAYTHRVDFFGKITTYPPIANGRKQLNYNGQNYFEVADQDGTNLRSYRFELWAFNNSEQPVFVTKDYELAQAVHLCLKRGISVP